MKAQTTHLAFTSDSQKSDPGRLDIEPLRRLHIPSAGPWQVTPTAITSPSRSQDIAPVTKTTATSQISRVEPSNVCPEVRERQAVVGFLQDCRLLIERQSTLCTTGLPYFSTRHLTKANIRPNVSVPSYWMPLQRPRVHLSHRVTELFQYSQHPMIDEMSTT